MRLLDEESEILKIKKNIIELDCSNYFIDALCQLINSDEILIDLSNINNAKDAKIKAKEIEKEILEGLKKLNIILEKNLGFFYYDE